MKQKIIPILISLTLIALSLFLINKGLYINNLSKPEAILGSFYKRIEDKYNKYIKSEYELLKEDNFTLNSKIDFNIDSEYYKNRLNDENYLKKYNYINNINYMGTDIILKQDINNKKGLIQISSKIGDESIINIKELIDNSTNYYIFPNILNHYINNGSCNYFENIDDKHMTKDQLIYIRDFVLKSFANNLDDDFIDTYQKEIEIDGKNKEVNELTIKFDNLSIRYLLNGILNDLKEDEESNKILSNIFKDFSNYSFSDDIMFLDDEEYYMFHIYSSKILYKPLKYELLHMNGNNKEDYVYEDLDNRGLFYYLVNNKVIYQSDIMFYNNKIMGVIKGSRGKELGKIELDRDNNNDNIVVSFNLEDGNKREDFTYTLKYNSVKGKKEYTSSRVLSFKSIVDNESILSGTISMDNTISRDVEIKEDLSNAIMSSNVEDEYKNRINNYFNEVKERLER